MTDRRRCLKVWVLRGIGAAPAVLTWGVLTLAALGSCGPVNLEAPPDYELFPSRYGAVIAKDDLPRVSFPDEVNRESEATISILEIAQITDVELAGVYLPRSLIRGFGRLDRRGAVRLARKALELRPRQSGSPLLPSGIPPDEYRLPQVSETDGTPFPSSPSFSSAGACSGGAGNAFSPSFGHPFGL